MMRDITMTISLISADLVTPRTRAIAFCLVNEQVDGVKEYAMKMESVSVLWKRDFITDSLVYERSLSGSGASPNAAATA
ncbi:hypothetical protein LOK49_Contig3G00017 [Camellia lanceoleosa]|nr:hypothetical protein LOK49_Contig3G00017 [Camellia lanceoleosa]